VCGAKYRSSVMRAPGMSQSSCPCKGIDYTGKRDWNTLDGRMEASSSMHPAKLCRG